MNKKAEWISYNGKVTRREDALIPAENPGLFYGAGCFETMLSDHGSIFRFREHVNRMAGGLTYLGIQERFIISAESLHNQIQELLDVNSLLEEKAKVRVQACLKGSGGYKTDESADLFLLITADPVMSDRAPQKLILSDTRVVPTDCKPAKYKLSNMLHYRQAAREAQAKGSDDAVMLTVGGSVAETSIANIFWKNGDVIYTPSEFCDILPGITRNALLELLENEKTYTVEEGIFEPQSLFDSELVWLTNSVMGIVPVSGIGDVYYQTEDPFFDWIREGFHSMKNSEASED